MDNLEVNIVQYHEIPSKKEKKYNKFLSLKKVMLSLDPEV